MRQLMYLSSLDNHRVKTVLNLRRHRHRAQSGLFIAEGQRQITRALAAKLPLRELYKCPELGSGDDQLFTDAIDCLPPSVAQFEVSPRVMRKLAYRAQPQDMLAVFEQPRWTLNTLPTSAANPLWLVAVGIEKPGNLGALTRSAVAAGAAALLVADGVVDLFNPNTIHASTGAVFALPVVAADTPSVITWLNNRSVQIVAATPDAIVCYNDVNLTVPSAVVIGCEDVGLNKSWRDAAHCHVKIPMNQGSVDSLNAAAAAVVLLFEAVRQRRAI